MKIRLRRMGARKRPFYRLVVTDSRSPRDGKFLEILGTFDPLTEPVTLRLDTEKTRSWLQKGARPSDTARKFLIDNGLLPKESARKRPSKPPKSAAPVAPAAPTASAAPATPAAPVEEEAKA